VLGRKGTEMKLQEIMELANKLKTWGYQKASNILATFIIDQCLEVGTVEYQDGYESAGHEYYDLIRCSFEGQEYFLPVPLLRAEWAVYFHKTLPHTERCRHNRILSHPTYSERKETRKTMKEIYWEMGGHYLTKNARKKAENQWGDFITTYGGDEIAVEDAKRELSTATAEEKMELMDYIHQYEPEFPC